MQRAAPRSQALEALIGMVETGLLGMQLSLHPATVPPNYRHGPPAAAADAGAGSCAAAAPLPDDRALKLHPHPALCIVANILHQ